MHYGQVIPAVFLRRPNRFVAEVEIDGVPETVHVKNTGRCRELLLPGARVYLSRAAMDAGKSGAARATQNVGTPRSTARKTRYDLIAVEKVLPDVGLGAVAVNGSGSASHTGSAVLLVNIDSQAPNKVAAEWLCTQGFDLIRPEYPFGSSRMDFYLERRRGEDGGFGIADVHNSDICTTRTTDTDAANPRTVASKSSGDKSTGTCIQYLMEVKGCTLERGGIGYFPDAPTLRGVRHLKELAQACKQGYRAALAFVIQMDGIRQVLPNDETHPEFGHALAEARSAGVELLFLCCHVEPESLELTEVLRA